MKPLQSGCTTVIKKAGCYVFSKPPACTNWNISLLGLGIPAKPSCLLIMSLNQVVIITSPQAAKLSFSNSCSLLNLFTMLCVIALRFSLSSRYRLQVCHPVHTPTKFYGYYSYMYTPNSTPRTSVTHFHLPVLFNSSTIS